jgi:transposase InsO family protein
MRAKEDKALLQEISQIYWSSQGRYGSPRVYQALKRKGFLISRKRVERLMREAGLVARCVKVVRHAPKLKQFQQAGSNLLLEMNEPTGCNQVWVGDVTYLKLNGRWQYLSTVMDVYSRRIIGWSLSDHRRTELTLASLNHALRRRGRPEKLVFHSDRGIEYLSYEFKDELARNGIKQSFNRAGYCGDNAFMESFFHTLKGELIRKSKYRNVKALRRALSGYINGFYNCVRIHSSIGYLSPIQYEKRYA